MRKRDDNGSCVCLFRQENHTESLRKSILQVMFVSAYTENYRRHYWTAIHSSAVYFFGRQNNYKYYEDDHRGCGFRQFSI